MKSIYTIMAMAMVVAMAGGAVAADSVDIGLGRMDRAEFDALRQMVAGDYQPNRSVTTEVHEGTTVAEFYVRDVEQIRQAMVGGRDQGVMTASTATTGDLVDIGLGSMSTGDFCDLNKLVASNTTGQDRGFAFMCP